MGKSANIKAPPSIAEAKIVEKEAPPEKPKPGKLIRVNPGRLDRVKE